MDPVAQLEDNLKALDFKLSESQIKRLDDVSKPDLGWPHTFLGGTTYQDSRWLKFGGTQLF